MIELHRSLRAWFRRRPSYPHVWSWWEVVERPATQFFSDGAMTKDRKRVQTRRCAQCGLTEEVPLYPNADEPVGCTASEQRE